MSAGPRMTMQVQAVLRAFLTDPAQRRYGLELCAATTLPSGTVYPILARLERIGWVESHWEEGGAQAGEGRPRRRYYTITSDGAERSRDAIARAYTSRRQPAPYWLEGPVGGPA
ncbi:PadR family transcriptional regulator [Nonomuraea jiangxiensis]|uniref:Transcriptional regulator PadR-like family protein n=1 Tax=Nonomuraea jiangxiensis TaxID=633440 RepID=A0A1G9C3B2_9ACTN|nr:helix-turn-helix transcriptional regulator [Nonomuraea jiangxiensis]SDK46160.1 Transcriptional regulator PadR-like family protein [Nonomuraea jiangxiensis]